MITTITPTEQTMMLRIEALEAERDALLADARSDEMLIEAARDSAARAIAERDEYQRAADEMAMAHKVERDALRADADRYLEKLIECRSSVKIAANEFDRFMIRKQPNENQCDIDEQIRLLDLLNWIDTAIEGKS